jgi:hypothetical protein
LPADYILERKLKLCKFVCHSFTTANLAFLALYLKMN